MKYFKMKEFECRCGCVMPAEVKANIEALVHNVLDPVRDAYGKPIGVNSGFRCEKHNKAVGGVPRSQHLVGEAADIRPAGRTAHPSPLIPASEPESPELMTLARIIVQQGRFDQLILYPTFLHVSYKRNGANRHKVLRKTATGYAEISHREIC